MEPSRRAQAKRWVFTLNNPDAEFDDHWMELLEADDSIEYSAWQLEIGENGTPHIQGLVLFAKKVRLSGCRRFLDTAHWEIMRGTVEQAIAYCHKEDTRAPGVEPKSYGFYEVTQGRRTDLLEVKRKIDDGASLETVADENFATWCRYGRSFTEYKRMKTPARDFKTLVDVVIGPTGTGKSFYAANQALAGDTYFKQNSPWWDGYTGQSVVVLDDFYGWLKLDDMLRLMDRYPLLVQIKGGQAQFVSKRIIITSNTLPTSWYSKIFSAKTTSLAAFLRRINSFKFLGTDRSIVGSSYEPWLAQVQKLNFE